MPSLELINETHEWRLEGAFGREAVFPRGNVPLDLPLSSPPLTHLRLRRLRCACYGFRTATTDSTDRDVTTAIVDTGCPLSLFPRHIWQGRFRYEEGKHFEVCRIADFGERFRNQLLASSLLCRVVRLKVPVLLVGVSYSPDHFLRIDNLVAQFSDTDEPKQVLLGLWGGVFEGRRLLVDRAPTSDDLTARFEW